MAAKKKIKGLIKIGEVSSYRPTVAAVKSEDLMKEVINFTNNKIINTSYTRNDFLTKGLETLMIIEKGSIEEKLKIVGIGISDIVALINPQSTQKVEIIEKFDISSNISNKKNTFGDGLISTMPGQGMRRKKK